MKTSRFISFTFAIALLGFTTVSCSKSSVAEEDALYENHQGIDKYKIFVPTNG